MGWRYHDGEESLIELQPIKAFGKPATESAFMKIAVAAQVGIIETAMY